MGSAGQPGLTEPERAELQELRRQAEILKIRREVQAEADQPGHGAGPPRAAPEQRPTAAPEALTPKTKKLVKSETRIFSGGGCQNMVGDDAGTWADVRAQLQAHSIVEVRRLYTQVIPDGEVPRTREQMALKLVQVLQERSQ